MTQKEFLELYPDSDNDVLGEEMGMTAEQVRALAARLDVRKSEMHRSVKARRQRVLGAMRGEHVWNEEWKELKGLAVCLENYARINAICDMFSGEPLPSDREAKDGHTEAMLTGMMEECYARLYGTDSLSDEARRLNDRIKDLQLRLYALRRKVCRRDPPVSSSDYVFLRNE